MAFLQPDWTRILNLQIDSPMPENHKSVLKEAPTENTQNVLALCLALLEQIEPDLAVIVRAWLKLSAEQHKQILEIVKAV